MTNPEAPTPVPSFTSLRLNEDFKEYVMRKYTKPPTASEWIAEIRAFRAERAIRESLVDSTTYLEDFWYWLGLTEPNTVK